MYDIELGGYKTRTMRIRSFKADPVKNSQRTPNTNGLWEMYGVSDAYKTAMHQAVRKFRLTGTVGTAKFTDENILIGSFFITNQC